MTTHHGIYTTQPAVLVDAAQNTPRFKGQEQAASENEVQTLK